MRAVVAKQHRLRTFRAIKNGDDGTGFDFGDAATGVKELGFTSGVRHDEVALARFDTTRNAAKAVPVIKQDLSVNRVQGRR
jgi:hypothetical protein